MQKSRKSSLISSFDTPRCSAAFGRFHFAAKRASNDSFFEVLSTEGDLVSLLVPTHCLTESGVIVEETNFLTIPCTVVCCIEDHCVRVYFLHGLIGRVVAFVKVTPGPDQSVIFEGQLHFTRGLSYPCDAVAFIPKELHFELGCVLSAGSFATEQVTTT